MSIYNYEVKDKDGKVVSLEQYKGKVLLIVNTATGCGFTPQYEGLQKLYSKYKDEGFEVLDFPCNQFGNQAPGSNEEIAEFCTLKYNTTFKTFAKIDVNGDNEEGLYTYLKKEKAGIFGPNVKWNFTKFLVDKEGKVVGRYAPTFKPDQIERYIQKFV